MTEKSNDAKFDYIYMDSLSSKSVVGGVNNPIQKVFKFFQEVHTLKQKKKCTSVLNRINSMYFGEIKDLIEVTGYGMSISFKIYEATNMQVVS